MRQLAKARPSAVRALLSIFSRPWPALVPLSADGIGPKDRTHRLGDQ